MTVCTKILAKICASRKPFKRVFSISEYSCFLVPFSFVKFNKIKSGLMSKSYEINVYNGKTLSGKTLSQLLP